MAEAKRVCRETSSSGLPLDAFPHEIKVHLLSMCDSAEVFGLWARTCHQLADIARDLLPQMLEKWRRPDWERVKEKPGYTFYQHSGVLARGVWQEQGPCGFYCGMLGHAGNKYGKTVTKEILPFEWFMEPQVGVITSCSAETLYYMGEKHGTERHWDHNGQLVATCDYVHGEKHGEVRGYRKTESEVLWRDEPLCKPVSRDAKGAPDRSALAEAPIAGTLWWRAEYKDGEINGVAEMFHLDGTLKQCVHVKDGERFGAEDDYDEEGRLIFHAEWTHGNRRKYLASYEYGDDGKLYRRTRDWGGWEGRCDEFYYEDGTTLERVDISRPTEYVKRQYRPDGTLWKEDMIRFDDGGSFLSQREYLYNADGVTLKLD